MFIFYVLCCKPQLTAITMQYYVYKTFKLGVISQLGVVNECSLFQTFLNNLLHLLSRDGCGDIFHKNLQENGHTQKKKNSEEEKWSRQNKLSLRTQKCTGMALVNPELNHGVEIPDSSMQADFCLRILIQFGISHSHYLFASYFFVNVINAYPVVGQCHLSGTDKDHLYILIVEEFATLKWRLHLSSLY